MKRRFAPARRSGETGLTWFHDTYYFHAQESYRDVKINGSPTR